MEPTERTKWLLPSSLSCDQTGELALAERAESKACRAKNQALIDCINKHNEEAQ